jgi:purine-nucleoside phosphorylase
LQIPRHHIRRHWFGIDSSEHMADTVLLLKRNRLDDYKAQLDTVTHEFEGVFPGISGTFRGKLVSIVFCDGPAHLADCVNFLCDGFDIQRVVSAGTVGGLKMEIGDMIVSNSCITQDGYSLTTLSERIRYDDVVGPTVKVEIPSRFSLPASLIQRLQQVYGMKVRTGKLFTVAAIALESEEWLQRMISLGSCAVDLGSGSFLTAALLQGVEACCLHWVTDTPLQRNFYYRFAGDEAIARADEQTKHTRWGQMPAIVLEVMSEADFKADSPANRSTASL